MSNLSLSVSISYAYPKVSRDILDAIGIALETTPRLYTQVLHLMNRMNLEPPFVAADRTLRFACATRDAATQTNDQRCADGLLSSGESELESSDDGSRCVAPDRRKRRANDGDSELMQHKRIRQILTQTSGQMKSAPRIASAVCRADLFEAAPTLPAMPPIRIVVASIAPNIESHHPAVDHPIDPIESPPQQPIMAAFSLDTLRHERIPVDQLAVHPLFVGYEPGAPSAKLYVKNIGKAVTPQQLEQLFGLFVPRDATTLGTVEVRLMRTGRMKGQAFVTYAGGPYLSDDQVLDAARRARAETNGLLVDGRPIVVAFGRQTTAKATGTE